MRAVWRGKGAGIRGIHEPLGVHGFLLCVSCVCGIIRIKISVGIDTGHIIHGGGKLELTKEWDKTFPKSEKVNHRKVTFPNRYGITLAADLYEPKGVEVNPFLTFMQAVHQVAAVLPQRFNHILNLAVTIQPAPEHHPKQEILL